MQLIFLGSGEFGTPTLKRLMDQHNVCAVVSQLDRPAGRKREPTPTPIAKLAIEHNLKLLRCRDVNTPSVVEQIKELQPDAAVVIAFGQKLGPELIAVLGKLSINLHASLLPKYRGAAPINWAIIRGERQTGVTVISLSQRMDAGLIYRQAVTDIVPMETAGELHDRLALLGPDLVESVLADFQAGKLLGTPQDESQVSKAPKLSKTDATLNFDRDADVVAAKINGLTPWPGVTVIWHRESDGREQELILRRAAAQPDLSCFIGLKGKPKPGMLLGHGRVAVRDGAIRIIEVQLPGGRPMPFEDFERGHFLSKGDILLEKPAIAG